MDEKFLYVFDDESKKKLEKAGFRLVASFAKKDIYVFLNDSRLTFALNDVKCFPSNKLTF